MLAYLVKNYNHHWKTNVINLKHSNILYINIVIKYKINTKLNQIKLSVKIHVHY